MGLWLNAKEFGNVFGAKMPLYLCSPWLKRMFALAQTIVRLGSNQKRLPDKGARFRQGFGTVLANIAVTKYTDIQLVKTNNGYVGTVFQFFRLYRNLSPRPCKGLGAGAVSLVRAAVNTPPPTPPLTGVGGTA